jgi:multiple sugar transport system ATP-binding protein
MTMADRIFIMNKGVLQQNGSPMDVYSRPANRFVAGFIGSPAMNFVDARLSQEGQELFIAADAFRVKVPDAFRPALAAHSGKAVAFGVRPEDITLLAPANADQGYTITARADVVEVLGSEIFIHLACGKDTLVARMPMPDVPVEVGETLHVDLALAKTHIFDKDSSITIV